MIGFFFEKKESPLLCVTPGVRSLVATEILICHHSMPFLRNSITFSYTPMAHAIGYRYAEALPLEIGDYLCRA